MVYWGPRLTDLADDLQMFIAGKWVVLQAVVHFLMPVSPLHIKLCQRLCATRLKDFHRKFRDDIHHCLVYELVWIMQMSRLWCRNINSRSVWYKWREGGVQAETGVSTKFNVVLSVAPHFVYTHFLKRDTNSWYVTPAQTFFDKYLRAI